MAKQDDDDLWRQLAVHANSYHSSEDPHFREHYAGLVSEHFAGGGMIKLHPAMKIPGVHIRTAEAGEPFFHGDK
jgi:hypothetical protein